MRLRPYLCALKMDFRMMRNRLAGMLMFLGCLLASSVAHAQIDVTENYTAAALAQKLAGPGVTILNPVLNCPVQANGLFRVITSNIGIDSGIILTTGRAATNGAGIGVNGASFNLASTRNNGNGDRDLEPLAGQATHDACALEFDVIPQGDTVKFDYVFGSEEYINATCGPYNDAFAFFISGPGIGTTDNMALVPGTNIPVTINSINSGVPGPNYSLSGCTSMGPGSPFTSYFVNNSAGTSITYQGFTTVLQAVHQVIPCSTYHLKMVIADGGNYIYDSGVFIRAGSLQANTLSITPVGGDSRTSRADAFAVKECAAGSFRIHRPQAKATAETVHYTIAGTAVNGYDYNLIPDSVIIPAGQQEVAITIRGLATPANGPKVVTLLLHAPNNCSGATIADSASLTLLDTIHVAILTPDTAICKGEQLQLRVAGDTMLTYQWTPAYLLDNGFKKDPIATPLTTTRFVLNASWPQVGCAPRQDAVLITVLPVPEVSVAARQRVCLHDSILFSATVTPPYPNYTFTWTGPNGFIAFGMNPQLRNAHFSDSGRYAVAVGLDTNRCVGRDTFYVTVEAPPLPVTTPVIFCQGKPATPLTAFGSQLQWFTTPSGGQGVDKLVPETNNLGITTFYVSQTSFGCESERAALPVEVKVCCDRPVYVPTAFTPNNDGHNDRFTPRFPGYGHTEARLRIYNRWGQMIFQSFDGTGWDGTWNNHEMPGGAYFYELLVDCKEGAQEQYTGDITLVR